MQNEEIPVFFTKYSRQITDKDGKLDKLRELKDNYDSMETWTQIALEVL